MSRVADSVFLRPLRWLAPHVAVFFMATMFVSFLLQIFFRYVLNRPLGWTEEVTVLCWVWVVLWSAAFLVPDEEEVRFDVVYSKVPPQFRRAFTIVSSIALVVLLALSVPATWRYIVFMKREHSAYLHMRFDLLYSIYLIFVAAAIVKHVQVAWLAIRSGPEAGADPKAADDVGDRVGKA